MFVLKLQLCAMEVDEQNKALLCGGRGSQEGRVLGLRQLDVLTDALHPLHCPFLAIYPSYSYFFAIVRRRHQPPLT